MFRSTQILTGVLAVTFLFVLRPLVLGGTLSYIPVDQSSFEPTLHKGDLAVVSQQSNYSIGQLVAFETRQGSYLGRIVGVEDLVYQIWKGDADQPVPVPHETVVGRLWFKVANFGRWLGGTIVEPLSLGGEAAP